MSVSKNIVNKYNDKYSTYKMKPVDVKPRRYNDSSKEIIYQDPKFKIGDIVTISKKWIIFSKGYSSTLVLSFCD